MFHIGSRLRIASLKLLMAPPDSSPGSETGSRLPKDWDLGPFDHVPGTRIVFGDGAAGRVGEFASGLGGNRVLLVTDPGIVRAGHAEKLRIKLLDHVREVCLFDRARENPDTTSVDECLAAARAFRPDLIVGLGGGSAMDTGKACNFLLTNGGRMADYWGVGKARLPMLPFLAVPTTSGTGSECQSAALIADAESRVKMACLDPKALPKVAILDPELTLSQPARVTACAGIDAIAHAVETAVCSKRTALSGMYSREAFRLLASGFPGVLANPFDLEARGRMLLGSALAGCAIEGSMLGAAHAAANPLTARCHVVHGVAVGLMLPHVMRFNALEPQVNRTYAELARIAGLGAHDASDATLSAFLVTRLEEFLLKAGLPSRLWEAGAAVDLIPAFSADAERQWTARFNPRPVAAPDFLRLYQAACLPRIEQPGRGSPRSRPPSEAQTASS